MSRIDAGQEVTDDLLVLDCEAVRLLRAACCDGITRLAEVDAPDPTTAEGAAALHWLSRLSCEYERRALELQELRARGGRGLVAKGEQLAALLDYKAASIDDGLLRAMRLYIANTRQLAGDRQLAWEPGAARQSTPSRRSSLRRPQLRAVDGSFSPSVSDVSAIDQA